MKRIAMFLAVGALVLPIATAHGQSGMHSIGLNAASIKGFPSGELSLTGAGDYDPRSDFVRVGGGFRCTQDVNQGPLAGCRAGEGIRWDADAILPSTGFKCTGSAAEPLKNAVTDDNTLVLRADFYRQGDGVNESFKANLIISRFDLDPDRPGIQNVWVQGVGCGEAIVNFN